MALQFVILLLVSSLVAAQRPFFAGFRPIGYPTTAPTTTSSDLANRFDGNNETTTTQRLPIEALGDKDLVDRLSKLPKDQQPFWLLNWQALEDMRKNPQTYPHRPSHFSQPLDPAFSESLTPSNGNPSGFSSSSQFSSGTSGSNFGTANSGATNVEFVPFNANPENVIPNPSTTTTNVFENRFGDDDTSLETPRITPRPVLKPTYPIYAHVDDVLANKYVPSQTSQSGSLKATWNKPASDNRVKENRQLALHD
ncbi:uncharacterized protein LOC113231239 [Hyposmocoma kahamanoa]|uniref:uncharacterized protein LOC113231239 n=1 Tax=Hyposmocoma kahamanoa TaxID=1477025 RepID=UPI000E6D94B5|nr:uncharacterized protein LOC113231239 [Hyposmocoma kahamanoa]